jgi:hypothetical protein
MRLLPLLLVLWIGPSLAEEVTICYNYSCAAQATVALSEARMREFEPLFRQLPNAAAERVAIAWAIGMFETSAGEQTPTHRDRGGNLNDEELDGRMDCIDHTHNTTAYLHLLEARGWLKFHHVQEPVRRAPLLVNEHWSAHIMEIDTQREFVVDSWFFDNGLPAAIYKLDEWRNGASPGV